MTNPPGKLTKWRFVLRGSHKQVVTGKARMWFEAREQAAAKLSNVHRRNVSRQDVVPAEERETEKTE